MIMKDSETVEEGRENTTENIINAKGEGFCEISETISHLNYFHM